MIELPDDVRALLDAPNLAHIATLMPDGSPHAVTIWIATQGPHVVFLTGPGSQKARNLGRDARVAFSVVDRKNPFSIAAVRGRVVEMIDGDRAWEIIDRISQSYLGRPYPRGPERVVYLVEPEYAKAIKLG